jgi:hypothetical protein
LVRLHFEHFVSKIDLWNVACTGINIRGLKALSPFKTDVCIYLWLPKLIYMYIYIYTYVYR